MKRTPVVRTPVPLGGALAVLAALLLLTVLALAWSGDALSSIGTEFDLSWWTVDGGGGTSSGGVYSLTGTAGQAEVGALMRGGAYELAGGFWGVGGQAGYGVYLPVVLRMSP
jgi:hypothetical protein